MSSILSILSPDFSVNPPPTIPSGKADIRNPLRYLQDHKESRLVRNPPVNGSLLTRFRKQVPLMIFHERSRFATCQWELSTPTDISIPLTHRLVLRALEAGECLSAFKIPPGFARTHVRTDSQDPLSLLLRSTAQCTSLFSFFQVRVCKFSAKCP